MNWFRGRKEERELDEEIREHIEIETRENIERGMTPGAARDAARRKFGNSTRVKEQVRALRIGPFLETVGQDVRYAVRMLRQSPAFALIAIASLALGIAVNSAIFSALCASWFPTSPYKDAQGIAVVHAKSKKAGPFAPLSFAEYDEVRKQSASLSEVAAATNPGNFNMSSGADLPERLAGLRVTPSMFSFLGVTPVYGRDFAPDEDQPGHDHVVIIGSAFWNRRFENSPHVLGRQLKLNGESYSIIGVLPPWFTWLGSSPTDCGDPVGEHYCLDVFVPVSRDNPPQNLMVFARLRPGVARDQARSELGLIAQRLNSQSADPDPGRTFGLAGFFDLKATLKPQAAIILQCTVAFVLLIACANIANLLLIRASGRAREIALRCAIGAARRRVIRQLTTEGLVLGLLGGILGLFLTPWVIQVLVSVTGIRLLDGIVDYRVVLFTAASVLVTALLFALVPAIHGARSDVSKALKAGSYAVRGAATRLRLSLVAFEIAISMVLIVGAVLMGRSAVQYSQINPGFNVQNVLFTIIPMSDKKYTDETLRRTTIRQLVDKARALPGVTSAAVVSGPPLYAGESMPVRTENDSRPSNELPTVRYRAVGADYFHLLGVRIVQGRDFKSGDADSSIVIVNDVMARQLWPDENPIGKQIAIVTDPKQVLWRQVVGVMPEMRDRALVEEKRPQVVELNSAPAGSPWLMVRTASDPRSFVRPLREAVAHVDKDQPIAALQTMQQAFNRQFNEVLIGMKFFSIFAGLALLLAALGIYGVVAYYFRQRRAEMGVRTALGASRSHIYRLIFWQSFKVALAGVIIGVVLARVATRFLQSALYDVSPADPLSFAVTAVILFLVALLAAWAPAHHAARVDPIEALRYE